ncbi:MAG TPA: transglycosylase SLT domain-containing protein [Nitrospiraceae bacterium]|nr:transglycosylase SLT domain-containing protein [Nitrospiraceae bacterium]
MRATFVRLTVFLLLGLPSSILAVGDVSQTVAPACETAEACFHAALIPLDSATSSQEPLQRKLERLRTVQEQHPGSLWGKRAGLLTGILLIERDPAEALRFFKIAQRDWPLLDDYIRLWMGDAMLKAGDAPQAAAMFESIPEAVPDTVLVTRALFRSGEAWSRAGQCRKAIDLLSRAAAPSAQEIYAPTVLLLLAECQFHENRPSDATHTLKQIWVRYPNSPEAREAEARLAPKKQAGGWHPTADDWYARAVSFSTLALHADAVDAFQKFLDVAPHEPRRAEVKFKMGLSLVRLKRYDQAREVFRNLASGRSKESAEAVVWLARVYLRQGAGDHLLALPRSVTTLTLSAEQAATVRLLGGMWLEDQERYDDALAQYRQVADGGPPQRAEALWRVGWLHYRNGRFQDALATFQNVLAGKEEPAITPQILYWAARTHDRLQDGHGAEWYAQLCRQYTFTYYCQLAPPDGKSRPVPVAANLPPSIDATTLDGNPNPNLARDRRYLKAFELKLLGMDLDAAKELSTLIERYAKDQTALIALSALLSEAGAHHQALRLARLYFKDPLERGGADMPLSVWSAAYPKAYLSMIRTHAGSAVDPFLAAAIIREESHYDARALSRVGAIGLMQVMPTTAQAVAKKLGLPQVTRDDLFDQEINIRFGVRYLEQLLQQYGGNVIYTVAAYNAGPPAVSAWATKFGSKDPDEFVELIPYQETRQYVKRVLRSYREYFRLAGVVCTAPSLDKTC